MPTMQVTGLMAAIGIGADHDIIPVAGTAYCITEVFSDIAFVGGPPTVPEVQVSLFDGAHAECIVLLDPGIAVQKNRPLELYINPACYARLQNTDGVGAAVIGWSGHRVSPNIVMTSIVTAPTAAPGNVDFRPTAAQGVWRVTEIGAQTMNASNNPDITVVLQNGVLADAMLADGARNAVWPGLLNWYISNALYLTFDPIGAADCDVGVSAVRVAKELYGAVVTLAAGVGAATAVQPADGVDAVVTAVASSIWVGIGVAGNPDCAVQLTDGATPTTIIEDGTAGDSARKVRNFEIEINNAAYLQVINTPGGAHNFAYTGYISRRWNP